MRALSLKEPGGQLRPEAAALPQPGPTEVRGRACMWQLEEADEVLHSIEHMELAGRACVTLPQA
jgi:hypothetical protein